VDEEPPEDMAINQKQDPISYESRLQEITKTKFKGDSNNVPESVVVKQPTVGDTREFEYLESEIVDETIHLENQGGAAADFDQAYLARHQTTIKEEIAANDHEEIDEYLKYQEAYRREQEAINENLGANAEPAMSQVVSMPEFYKVKEERQMQMSLPNAETDPYLASAIEFMYSEDTEDDFNTLGRK
jgi:hypothetical protein